jgi:hypothetical protein
MTLCVVARAEHEESAMTDYHREIDIEVSADKAFAFVSNLDNLPLFVPTTRHAEADEGHVHVEGVSEGHSYHDDGQLYVDADRRMSVGVPVRAPIGAN